MPAKKIFKPAKQPKRAVRSTAETTKKVARKGEVSQSFLWRQTFKKTDANEFIYPCGTVSFFAYLSFSGLKKFGLRMAQPYHIIKDEWLLSWCFHAGEKFILILNWVCYQRAVK